MEKLVFSICLVVVGIGVGYVFQIILKHRNRSLAQTQPVLTTPPGSPRGIPKGIEIDEIRKNLQRAALLFFNPVAILGATWVANVQDIKIAAMPVIGSLALFIGGVLAFVSAKLLKLNSKQTGSYIVCGGFTNIGSLGALFCFIFLGEAGFALVPFYKLFEELIYYAVGFPIAKSFSDDLTGSPSFFSRLKSAATDIFVLVAVSSILIGLLLNLSGVQRPGVYAGINSIFIPLAAFLLLVSIGMAMRFSSMKTYFKPALMVSGIKFLIVPVLIVGLGSFLGLGNIDNGLPLKVILILSSMPVGFIAMVPPTIYKLDIDVANSCWLMTNAFLLVEIPLLLFLIQHI